MNAARKNSAKKGVNQPVVKGKGTGKGIPGSKNDSDSTGALGFSAKVISKPLNDIHLQHEKTFGEEGGVLGKGAPGLPKSEKTNIPPKEEEMDEESRKIYGIQKVYDVVKITEGTDHNIVEVGLDLTTLGLKLKNANEYEILLIFFRKLSSTFISPFSYSSSSQTQS